MATTNFNLPTYAAGDVAKFMTMGGWNEAMEAIDTAIAGGGEAGIGQEQSYTYVGEWDANSTEGTLSVSGTATDFNKVEVFSYDPAVKVTGISITDGESGKVDIVVTAETAPTVKTTFNITLVRRITA